LHDRREDGGSTPPLGTSAEAFGHWRAQGAVNAPPQGCGVQLPLSALLAAWPKLEGQPEND